MRDVLAELVAWCGSGVTVGLGTVVGTWESAPRAPGAALVVGPDGTVAGSVSGGCVEADVYALAEQVAADGQPVLQRYGVSDADAGAVGLPCGGSLEVFVEPVTAHSFPQLPGLALDMAAGHPVSVATMVEHPDRALLGRRLVVRPDAPAEGSLGSSGLDAVVAEDAGGLLAAGVSELLTYGLNGERLGTGVRVFVTSFASKPRMLLFGAIDFAAALARQGALLGYRVTVCDARPVFTTAARFPGVDEVVLDWPHRYLAAEAAAGRVDGTTVVCVLTHDPKFDVPLLQVALELPELGYLGAMGSRRTVTDRSRRLREAGVAEDQLSRICSPMGLDLGARTPEETAVSIAAEVVSLRLHGRGHRLVDGSGPIHH